MGQKTHPFGFRVGVTEAHKSRWYAPKALFGELLVEDYKIRKYVDKRLNRTPPFAAVSDIHIERTREELTVLVKTARPGLVIGPKGAEIDKLTQDTQLGKGHKDSLRQFIEDFVSDYYDESNQRLGALLSTDLAAPGYRVGTTNAHSTDRGMPASEASAL